MVESKADVKDDDRGMVLGIAGSPRRAGNSATLLESVLGNLADEFRTEQVHLTDIEIQPCQGCHRCEGSGICWLEDEMVEFWQKLIRADALILASPAYMGGLASRMHAFMERTWPLRKGRLAGKLGSYVIVGRRRPGMATGIMEEYFTRMKMTKLPGVLGYAFEPGEIAEDEESYTQVQRLADQCRRQLRSMMR